MSRIPQRRKLSKVPINAKIRMVKILSKKILLCREKEASNIRGGRRIKKNKVGENCGS